MPQDKHLKRPLTTAVIAIFFAFGLNTAQLPTSAEQGPNSANQVKESLSGPTVIAPGAPLAAQLILSNTSASAVAAHVQFTLQDDPADFGGAPPDPMYGYDRALGAKNWTVADGKTIDQGSLTDGKSWTSAGTDWIGSHWSEADQYIDLGKPMTIDRMTWESGDANWVDKVDVAGSMDGQTYVDVPSAQNVVVYHKWGTNDFPISAPFRARFLRFHYHVDGPKLSALRMPSAVHVYTGFAGESTVLPDVGTVLVSGERKVILPPGESITTTLQGSNALSPGEYLLGVKTKAGASTILDWQHIIVGPYPIHVSESSRFGINGADPKLTPKLADLGVGWVRFENMKWPMASSQKGKFGYDGSIAPWHLDIDSIIKGYRDSGLHVLPYLFLTQNYDEPVGGEPPAAEFTQPPKDFPGYADFVYQTVARFGATKHPDSDLETVDKKSGLNLINVYELWNEPNMNNPDWGSWKGTMSSYYDMFRLGAEAAKRADPTALVTNAGLSGIGVNLVDGMRTYKYPDGKCPLDFVDVINVHFYTEQSPPETATINADTGLAGSTDTKTFEQDLALLNKWREQYKPKDPIWLTETGYETNDYGTDERTQAAWLPRDVLICLANGIDKVMVYREAGSDQGRWAGAGVLRTDGAPKPSFFTYATLIRQMNGVHGSAVRVNTGNDNVRVYLWKDGDQTLITAWTIQGTAPFAFDLGKASVTDSFGFTQSSVPTSKLTLTEFPVYIRGCTNTAALASLLGKQ